VSFLRRERAVLDELLPGLDATLAATPMLEMETRESTALQVFRAAGGPALLVPKEHGGIGASLSDAVRVQRAIGSRSPSLAVATCMHHFSVASLVELTAVSGGFEWALLSAIAESSWYLSSGFAEGRTGQHILAPTMRATVVDGGLLVSGTKKPCSLTWSMDLLSASVAVTDPDGGPDRMAVVLVPAATPGIERTRFWQSAVLAGAESDAVELHDVHVPDALVFYPATSAVMDPVQARGFVWFELLVALVERVLHAGRGEPADRTLLVVELEQAAAALEQVADAAATTGTDELLARALFVRYGAERTVERVVMAAAGLAGGIAYLTSPEVSYLLAVGRALAFHPPSRASASAPLDRYLAGDPLVL
jgi:alkylation response protein AidB-like acyl-CoA dehydrogenase